MHDWRRNLRDRLAPLGLSAAAEADLVEELGEHLELEWLDASRRYGPDEATQQILAQLAETDLRELAARRASRAVPAPGVAAPTRGERHWLADLRDDVRYGLRTLRRAPLFAGVAILTLGLGIGATTVVYGVIDAVLVRTLPFADPDGLVRLLPANAGGRQNLSVADFFALRARVRAFASIASYTTFDDGLTFTGGDQPERVYGASVTGDFFATLGVAPLRGRTFSRDDELPGAPPLIVLGYDFWQRRLGGVRDIVGRSIEIQGARVPVVGVMPFGFWFPRGDRAEFWMNYRPTVPACECAFTKRVIARVAPGVGPQRLQAELDAAASDVRARFSGGPHDWTFVAKPLRETMVAGVKPVLLLLFAAVAFVLLIACVNVINLLLARAAAREAELSVRVALGASRGRLARQLLAETAVLAAGGGVFALLVARSALAAILALTPSATPLVHDVSVGVNAHVLGVAGACVFLCTLLVGAAPAIVVAERDSRSTTRAASARARATGWSRLRDTLVVAEIALALMLVVGAGLMIRSLAKLRAVDTGIRTDGVVTASISLPRTRYDRSGSIATFTDRVLEELAAVPGVSQAAITTGLPPADGGDQQQFLIEGSPMTDARWEPVADHLLVSDAYFAAMGIPLRAGRLFDARDRETLAPPAIISEALAARFFPGRSPLGHRMRLSGDRSITIIGVVGNAAYEGLASDVRLAIYEPFAHLPQWSFSVVARLDGDPSAIVPALRRIVASIDRGVAVAQVRTVRELMDNASAANRFRALLLGVLAGLALLLALVGIYGLISFVVGARTRELGIRIALGAGGGAITWLVVGQALSRAALGVLIGAAGALALSRALTTMLFGVSPTDPLTFAAVALLVLAAAAAASWFPARRAAHSDPVLALRAE